ncbi:MAG: hypothetical protein ACJ8F3_05400 [Xanthobacteraceae bacterium]
MLLHKMFTYAVLTGAAVILWAASSLAHDLPGIPTQHQSCCQNAETMPGSMPRKVKGWAKCCNHAEVFRTLSRVSATDNGDDGYYQLPNGSWKLIPRDIIHPLNEHAPDGQPTLFILLGIETCFFLGEGAI